MTMQLTALHVPPTPPAHPPRRILITGSQGQLGRALQQELAADVLLCVDQPEFDVADPAATRFVVDLAPDLVIHAAAYTNVDGAEAQPDLVFRINTLGTQNIALACQRLRVPMLYVSTNEVFDGTRTATPYYEWDQTNPQSVYARSKAAGERTVMALLDQFYVVRIAWHFARGGINFPRKILEAADRHATLRVVDDEYGNPTYAPDLAAALARLVTTGHFGIYHLTNSGACSRYEFACEVLRLAGRADVPVTPIASAEWLRPTQPPLHAILANTAGAALGITLRPWQEALVDFLAS